jgi:branched-subunit amino acid transport protein
MATTTFSCRYLFFAKTLNLRIGPKFKKAHTYTARSVLTAMWVPIVFSSELSETDTIFNSPYFYAGMFATLLSLKVKSTLIVAIGSMALFFMLKSII